MDLQNKFSLVVVIIKHGIKRSLTIFQRLVWGMPTPVLPGYILKRLRLMEREQRQDLVLIYSPWAIINTIIMMKVCTI